MSEARANQEWLHDLNTSGATQEAAIADLRDLQRLENEGRLPSVNDLQDLIY